MEWQRYEEKTVTDECESTYKTAVRCAKTGIALGFYENGLNVAACKHVIRLFVQSSEFIDRKVGTQLVTIEYCEADYYYFRGGIAVRFLFLASMVAACTHVLLLLIRSK